MQTNTSRGMQTLEQSLAELTLRQVITLETAMGASSRPDQLESLLERAGFKVELLPQEEATPALRVAGAPLL